MTTMTSMPLAMTDDRLTFGAAGWLWALLLLLPLLWVYRDAARRRALLLAKILAPKLQASLAGQVSPLRRNLRAAALLMSLALILLGAARPRFGSVDQEIRSRGRDVIIAIDTSRSMLSTDTAPTRLGRAKLISQDLLNLLKGDRVGVIAFAGTAFLQAPLTLDKGAVLTTIDDLDTSTIPKGGTDIASAIRLAIAAFGKGETMSRALVLMTDGEELDESAVAAAQEAQAAGIRIFTIGFGSPSGSLIPIRTEDGRNDFVRDENGRPVNSKLDAARLTEIAKATGGFYEPYGQDAAELIYKRGIVPMEQEETGVLSAHKPIERYAWPASAALLLLLLWSVLGEGRGGRAGNRSASAATLAVLVLFLMPAHLRADPAGLSRYRQGDYRGALKDFESRLQSGSRSPEVRFDAGAAAYKAGDFKKAAEYFSGAMTSADPKIRQAATYNLANSLVRTGEAAQEKDAKLSDWNNALQHYESVLKERPSDAAAKENRDIVKKLIEDLKRQEQKKNQQNQDQKKNQNKDDKQDKDKSSSDKSQGGGQGQDEKKDQDKNKDSKEDQKKSDQSQGGGPGEKDRNQDQNKDQKDQQKNSDKDSKDSQNDKGKGGATPTPTPSASASPSPGTSGGQNPKPGQDGDSRKDSASQQQNPQDDKGAAHGVQPTPTPSSAGKQAQGAAASPTPSGSPQQSAPDAAEAEEGKDGRMSTNQARALLRSVEDEEAHQLINQQNRAVEQPHRDW